MIDQKILSDIALIEAYCKGELSEYEHNLVDERVGQDAEFADLFSWAESFFDPAETFLYEFFNQKEIKQSREDFQNFVNGLHDPLNTVEEIAEKLPKRFKPTEKNYIFTSDRLEVLEIKEGVLRYWEDLRAPGVVCKFDLPITHNELLNILTNKPTLQGFTNLH